MNSRELMQSVSECSGKCVCMLFTMIALGTFSFGQTAGAGTLTDTKTVTNTSGNCTETYTTNTWTYTDALGEAHTFPYTTENILFKSCSSSWAPLRS